MAINLDTLTITEAHRALQAGEYTVRELVDAYLARISERNDELGAYLHLFEGIDQQVEVAQARYDAGEATTLTGIPIAVKANIQVAGEICSAGSKMLEEYRAVYDATAIARLREAGVIFLGSANMDEFAMGSSTEHSAFGVVKNPRDTDRVPGGSSGGSAAAVAAGMALAALGTDTGGSIRQPASFTGVVGYKGSYGSVSRWGAAAMGSSLDQIGPLAKSVEDVHILWKAMRGADEYDMTTIQDGDYQDATEQSSYRIAVPKDFLEGTDAQTRAAFDSAVQTLKNAGHTVEEIKLPSLDHALAVYYIVMPAEVSSNLARYDGIRYGFVADKASNLLERYTKTRSEGFGSEVKRRIILGTYVLQAGYADKYYTKALALRESLKRDLGEVFGQFDAIITPTAPTPAFRHGEKSANPLEMYVADIYTVPANIAGVPAISVPAGMREDKLPIGVQLMGAFAGDEQLLQIARELEA